MKHLLLLFDIFFPSQCVCCGADVSFSDHHVCSECMSQCVKLHDSCKKCSGEIIDATCSICQNRYIYFTKNLSVFEYNTTIKKIIYALKFHKKKHIAYLLGDFLYARIHTQKEPIDIVTYVPMTHRRERKRGYNQSEVMARYIAKKLKVSCNKLLYDAKVASSQKTLHYRDRFLNVLSRFSPAKSASLQGKNILLVDDVFTTGATINECSKVLKKMGANCVFSLTVARVPINRNSI
jgi:competence protein ComFC